MDASINIQAMQTINPTWLRIGAAETLSGIPRRTLRRWIVDGRIPASHLLRTGRFECRVSRAWAAQQVAP